MGSNLFPPLKTENALVNDEIYFQLRLMMKREEFNGSAHRARNGSGNWTFDAEIKISQMYLDD